MLVFVDFTPSLVLRGFRFDGAAWVDLGSLSGDFFSGPQSMALDANGNPIVALLDNGALRVVRNTGTAWVAMGAVLDSVPNGTQSVGEPSLAIDGAGQPWVSVEPFPDPAGEPGALRRRDLRAGAGHADTDPRPPGAHLRQWGPGAGDR